MRIPDRNAVLGACALAIAVMGVPTTTPAATPPPASPTDDILTACTLPDVERPARCGSITDLHQDRPADGRRPQ